MKKKKHFGTCRICGEQKELTFEHVPPSATYNNKAAKIIKVMDFLELEHEKGLMPWELDKAKGRIIQKGIGDYYLCAECNNKTGSWYGHEYKKFIDGIMYARYQCMNHNCCGIDIQMKNIKPLQVFKQIITMFCDINTGLSKNDGIKEFLLDRYSTTFDTKKYRVSMYIMKSGVIRMNGFVAHGNIKETNTLAILSEIATIPVGFILFNDYAEDCLPAGTEITDFALYKYDAIDTIKLRLNIYENNTWLPMDYRSKDEIYKTIAENNSLK